MITLLLHLLRLLPFLCGGHRQLALENLALHQQLAVYKRTMTRPRLRTADRFFWVGLARVWAGWRGSPSPLLPLTPFCGGSGTASASTGPSSPAGPPWAARQSTRRSRPLSHKWARRIRSGARRELLKLGIDVAERTVSRLLPKRRRPPSQSWRTFLTNHVRDLVSIDFLRSLLLASGCSSSSLCSPTIA